jgi:hypothetical protein
VAPSLGALVAHHLADAGEAYQRAAEALRAAAAAVNLEPIAGLDPEALKTFAAVTDANRGGVESMAKRLPPRRVEPTEDPADA